jgi:Kelch motif
LATAWASLLAAISLASALLAAQAALGAGSGSFGPTGQMGSARYLPAAPPLPDGRVLVAGGSTGSSFLSSAEVFNPQTNTFSSAGIGAMGTARQGPAAAPLPDGRVLVAGGSNGSSLASAEVFAATNAFTFAVKGRKLLVTVKTSGKVSVSDAAAPLGASTAKKRKPRLQLRPSSASGDPPTITVSLILSKLAGQTLRRKGKVIVKARITFAPEGGLASTLTGKLVIKGKKKRK